MGRCTAEMIVCRCVRLRVSTCAPRDHARDAAPATCDAAPARAREVTAVVLYDCLVSQVSGRDKLALNPHQAFKVRRSCSGISYCSLGVYSKRIRKDICRDSAKSAM